MSDADTYFHKTWLGMVQPVDGLVVSIPVLVDAQCGERQPPHVQAKLVELCPSTREGEAGPEGHAITSLPAFLSQMLGFAPETFDVGDALPEALSLYVPEGHQTLRATMALKRTGGPLKAETADTTPASLAGSAYEMLVWEVPAGLDLDKPETVTGSWDYPPGAKFVRMLRHCHVPIGLLTNREAVRLVYAPHGESSGAITFRIDDMASVGGRPILDAFVMLLSANRFFGVINDENIKRTLPGILAESRKRQANVTNELADQVFEALQILLRGFEAAAERDGRDLLDDALAREGDHLYKGLLTVLLRLVFLLYSEDRGLLPTEHPFYAEHLSVLSLFEQLHADHGAHPDAMSRRFGAWGRLVTLFRAVFLGMSHGDLTMPPRRGSLFNPHEYPFLEGWGPAGSAPITQAEERAAVCVPSVDDETVFRVLEKLILLDGQRLSYRALDVEQIGSVYEALMGYHVMRMRSAAVCMKPDRVWVSAEEVMEVPTTRRAKWLKETIGINAAQGEKLNEELKSANDNAVVLEALAEFAAGGKRAAPWLSRARPGQLVLQPGTERRRTSSHYTPRSLSAPIVQRTLEPLLAVMGEAPRSERILNLKVCDPAMGSGAFLVEACRFLADQVLAAWTRENKVEVVAAEHGDPLLHARRLVAQRCLYGVDKNDAAVELGKLSLWLVTLSKTLPFTFLDHSLRHGDSLVGLDFDQIRNFHWKRPDGKPSAQLELFGREIAMALDEAIQLRQKIGELGDSPVDDREKARLFWDAQDALNRVRLIGDVLVGSFFVHDRGKDREAERAMRENLVRTWLLSGGPPVDELLAMQQEVRARIPVFHWTVEFPEVFYAERPDPLDENQVNCAAYLDAFIGNPPFLGQKFISGELGERYRDWLFSVHEGAQGKSDLVAHFFRRTASLLGSNGTIGLIATNTIGQGDTRESGLQRLLLAGFVIYEALTSIPWPGSAAVTVAIVHLAIGTPILATQGVRLDGERVSSISSRLTADAERPDPAHLACNVNHSYKGVEIAGQGFLVTPSEQDVLTTNDPRNGERIFMYIGGEDVNTSPTVTSSRFAIDFGSMDLDEARAWPELLERVERLVKPERQDMNRDSRRLNWWKYGEVQPALRQAIRDAGRAECLVAAIYTKHLIVSFQPTNRVFNNKVYVFPLATNTTFAVMQSRVHAAWAWLLSATLKQDLAYSCSDSFETFPFPAGAPDQTEEHLHDIGERVHAARAKYMVDENVGLTTTYNRLKDSSCTDARILVLRKLHEEMDQKVLEAYAKSDPEGLWPELEVPPFCPTTDDDKKKLKGFQDAVVDRVFALNAKRAEEEKVRGLGTGGTKKKGATRRTVSRRASPGNAAKKSGGRNRKADEQLELTGDDGD